MNLPRKGVQSIPQAGGSTHMLSMLDFLIQANTEARRAGVGRRIQSW